MRALQSQLQHELLRFQVAPGSIETLFIGGGTPSTVSPELYAPLFALLAPYLRENAEITTEANPNSATKTWLSGMRDLGVNRVSFGVQSFDSKKLKALNRAHTATEAIHAVENAKDVGFLHLSLDLIYNYQGDTQATLLADITQALSLPIDHISAYELTIESGTVFGRTPEARQENEGLAFFVAKEIQKRGFTHYEISNFGTYQSRHNKGYWRHEEYMGVGAGAVGYLDKKRLYPHKEIRTYIDDPCGCTEEILSENEILTEKIFLGLRSCIGISKTLLPPDMQAKADFLVSEKKLEATQTHYFNQNYFISDALALYLLE